MNEQDKSINRLKYQKGVVSYEGKSGVPYKWMMHENKGWFENAKRIQGDDWYWGCLIYTSPSPRDGLLYRIPSSA